MRPGRAPGWRYLVPLFAILALLAAAASTAQATFPGPIGRIAFLSDRSGTFEIYSARPDGSDARRLTDSGGGEAIFSDWSPDGHWIVFDSDRTGDLEVYLMRADGTGERRITFRPGFTGSAAFSPDGRSIVLEHARPDQALDLFILDLETRDWQRVTRTPNIIEADPQFSPDGEWIAFSNFPLSGDDRASVHLIRPDGTDRHRLTPLHLRGFLPDWRPDGARIVFTSNAGVPHSSIYTIRPDGSAIRRLTRGREVIEDLHATYSPGGGRIIFASNRGPAPDQFEFDLWVIHGDGTRLHRLKSSDAQELLPDWGPHAP
jgi:TolB protein